MEKIKCWLRSAVFLATVLLASAACAAVSVGVAQTLSDLTWPLLFNGIAPGAILAFIGKRYIDKQDKTNKELIEAKNLCASRLDGIEMIHQLRGCDQPDNMARNRRKEDR